MAYADDVTIVASGKSVDDARLQLQSLLDLTAAWAKDNRLSFSYAKCNVMLTTVSRRKAAGPPVLSGLTLDGQALSTMDHLTILGVDISSDLSWSRHAPTNSITGVQ
jgi:hypothetical protein